ncbi:hypothetical protein LQ340_003338 [Neofusicoccum parvum]|uniref:Uncharacterized protein n=1 Tax=Neofusicoccum parvum TaxID=310453 RepID=A0ACB5S8S5_9PEZI|nr:hypothetical protein LQ340_003338 [Neofusicoccum parvum]
MAARIPRRQPYWKSHAKGYAYVLFLCSAFSVMLIWGTKIDDDVPQHLVTNPNPITRESLPSGLPSQATKATTSDSTTYPFSPDDVVVMLKTSAATMWHRVPMHLSTSFANQTLTPNLLIYSDTAASIGGRPVIDALANASAALQASPDFEHRRALQQAARDNLDLDGTVDPAAAARLDKHKALPLAAHAAAHAAAWFVYMPDDAFFFWPALHARLARFDPDDPVALDDGGGAGAFAISRAAMRASFRADPGLARRWEQLATERRGAGQVLATALASKGVRVVAFPRSGSEVEAAAPPPGRGLARLGVGERGWCEPLVGVGAVRQRDVAELDAWERGFREKHGAEVVRHRDVFAGFVGPYLVAERDEWDNFADGEHYSSRTEPGGGAGLADAERRRRPWFSADACRSACVGEERCLQWRYIDGDCYHGSEVKRGHRVKYEVRMRSGWMMERIERLMRKECRPLPRAESHDLTL